MTLTFSYFTTYANFELKKRSTLKFFALHQQLDTININYPINFRIVGNYAISDESNRFVEHRTSHRILQNRYNNRRHAKKPTQASPSSEARRSDERPARTEYRIIHKVRRMIVGVLSLVLVLFSSTETEQFQYKHHDNDELLRALQDINSRCPNITRIYTLSENSVLGVPLYVIEFSPKPGHHEACKYWLIYFHSSNYVAITYLDHFIVLLDVSSSLSLISFVEMVLWQKSITFNWSIQQNSFRKCVACIAYLFCYHYSTVSIMITGFLIRKILPYC